MPFYVYEFAARSGYAVPLEAIAGAARRGAELRRAQGLRHAVGDGSRRTCSRGSTSSSARRRSSRRGFAGGAAGAVSGLAASFPDAVVALVRDPTPENGERVGALRASLQALPFHAASKMVLGLRGVPVRGGVRPPLREPERDRARRGRAHRARMARIVVAGSGAIGASVAYHLALLGADDVVVAERGELAGGSTSRAMGGVRQQFSTAEEVVLARESIEFLAALGPRFFRQVGYLFLATTDEGLAGARGAARAAERARRPGRARRPVGRARPRRRRRRSARRAAGATASPIRPASRARCCGARRSSASCVREHAPRRSVDARRARDRVRAVVARARGDGRRRAADPAALPAAARDRRRVAGLPDELPMVIEAETRLPLPPPRRPARARDGRPGAALDVRDDRRRVALRRPARAARAPLSAGGRRDDRATPGPASTT